MVDILYHFIAHYNTNIILIYNIMHSSDNKLPTLMPAAGSMWLHKASPATGNPVQWSFDCPTGMPVAGTVWPGH